MSAPSEINPWILCRDFMAASGKIVLGTSRSETDKADFWKAVEGIELTISDTMAQTRKWRAVSDPASEYYDTVMEHLRRMRTLVEYELCPILERATKKTPLFNLPQVLKRKVWSFLLPDLGDPVPPRAKALVPCRVEHMQSKKRRRESKSIDS